MTSLVGVSSDDVSMCRMKLVMDPNAMEEACCSLHASCVVLKTDSKGILADDHRAGDSDGLVCAPPPSPKPLTYKRRLNFMRSDAVLTLSLIHI